MAYTTNSLSELGHVVGGRSRLWIYNTGDSLNTVLSPGYISDGGKKRIQVGDVVLVAAGTLNPNLTATPTLVAAGVTSEFSQAASAAVPTWQPCIVSSISAYDSRGVPTLTSTATLQSVGSTNASLLANFRNLLDGGDATINPWQRGTSITNIAATNTYTADRWFMVAGAGSSAQNVKTADTSVAGFSQSFLIGRAQTAGGTSTIVVGQALESLDSIKAQGQPVTFSFWARANSGFASGVSGSLIGVQVSQGAGTDQSVSALANGTWTSQTDVISTTQALTTTMTRYSFSGVVSSTATQLGVQLKYTPTSTTAITGEAMIVNGLQLEVGTLTPFEHRDVEVELALAQRYFFQVTESTSGVVLGAGMIAGTNTALFVLQLPVQMRAAPTVTVTNGSFGANIVGTQTALTGMQAGSTHTVNYVSVTGLVTAVSGQATLLQSGSAGVGKIAVSADL